MEAKKIEKAIEDERAKVQGAMSGLLNVLIQQSLIAEFQARTVSIDKEGMEAAGEVESLEETLKELTPIVQARIAVLTRQSEEFLSKGDHAGANKKLKEIENAQGQIDSLQKKIDLKNERLLTLEQEKKVIAKKLFVEVYPLLPRTTHALIETMLDLLDKLWAGLEEYQRKTGTGPNRDFYGQELLKPYHRENLFVNGANNSALSTRLAKWF